MLRLRPCVLAIPSFLAVQPLSDARAAEPARPAKPFEFQGRAIYAGGGVGLLPDLKEATQAWSLTMTFPVSSWASIEAATFGFHFESLDAFGRERVGTVALGIGTGVRFEAPASQWFRPYAAIRFQHLHMLWDPWAMPRGGHEHVPGMNMDPSSMHRWGGGLAAGVEFRVVGRFRAGVEMGTSVFSGQGTNVAVQGLGFVGVGF